MVMRTSAYVDSINLYNGALEGSSSKGLSVRKGAAKPARRPSSIARRGSRPRYQCAEVPQGPGRSSLCLGLYRGAVWHLMPGVCVVDDPRATQACETAWFAESVADVRPKPGLGCPGGSVRICTEGAGKPATMILRAADLRWLPINTVTACRIMLMALFGRHVPDCEGRPCAYGNRTAFPVKFRSEIPTAVIRTFGNGGPACCRYRRLSRSQTRLGIRKSNYVARL